MFSLRKENPGYRVISNLFIILKPAKRFQLSSNGKENIKLILKFTIVRVIGKQQFALQIRS